MLERAKKLQSNGLLHAALEILNDLETSGQVTTAQLGELYNEQAKIYALMTSFHDVVNCLNKAIVHASNRDAWVRYNANLGYAYRRLSEFDTAYRYLSQLSVQLNEISPYNRGLLLLNLSAVQGINGFYIEAINSIQQSLTAFAEADFHEFDPMLLSNLGLAYSQIGENDRAEEYLKPVLKHGYVDAFVEMGRVYLRRGDINAGMAYAKDALSKVWSSVINYEKEELAILCHFLGEIAAQLQETELALRLGEKAQVFYGQLGMWRQWQDIESEMFQWGNSTPESAVLENSQVIPFNDIRHFLRCLDAVNSQELIHKKVSTLLDTRVQYVRLIGIQLQLDDQDQEDLVLASRFADYGLTALENEVAMSPMRSQQAMSQYRQHPSLSVQMLKSLNISDRVTDIILDHHENFDGTGFPRGKKEADINYLARILSVVDSYSEGIVMRGMVHSEVMAGITEKRGTAHDPNVCDAFMTLFSH